MNSRLNEIPAWALEDSDESMDFTKEEVVGDIETGKQETHKMEYFFTEVTGIKADIETIGKAAKTIDKINEQAMRALTSKEEDKLSKKLKPLIDQTNKRARKTKTLLGLLHEETGKLEKEGKINSSDLRVRKNMCTTLTRKFVDEMKLYQEAQQRYKCDIKKKVKRQVQAFGLSATDEDVDRVMRSEGGRDAFYKEKILAGSINDQVK